MIAGLFAWIALLQSALSAGERGLAELEELAELGLDAELVEAGLELVAPGGRLAGDGAARALVARALFEVGREAEAHALLERAPAGDAAGARAVALMRARLLIEGDRLREALDLLAAEPGAWDRPRFPDEPENLLLSGRALVRAERFELAEPLLGAFVAAARLHPEGPAAWHMLSTCALRRGDSERARACLAEEQGLSRWHELFKARRLQIRLDPSARLPRLGLALLWTEAGEFAKAEAVLEELLAREPKDAEAWLHLGEARRKRGANELAAVAYARALAEDPSEHRARYSLALVHRLAGRSGDARRELETLLSGPAADDPRFLGAHLATARLLLELGEPDAARGRYAEYQKRGGTEALEPAGSGH